MTSDDWLELTSLTGPALDRHPPPTPARPAQRAGVDWLQKVFFTITAVRARGGRGSRCVCAEGGGGGRSPVSADPTGQAPGAGGAGSRGSEGAGAESTLCRAAAAHQNLRDFPIRSDQPNLDVNV